MRKYDKRVFVDVDFGKTFGLSVSWDSGSVGSWISVNILLWEIQFTKLYKN